MKVIAMTPLHYGKHYLEYAIRSVMHHVDEHVIMYTPRPSYGFQTDLPCPDSTTELQDICAKFKHVKMLFGTWRNEVTHRNEGLKECKRRGAEIMLAVDADEVYDKDHLDQVLGWLAKDSSAHQYRISGFNHLWRSFYWMCTDQQSPDRIYDLRGGGDKLAVDYVHCRVWHFGYAQPIETMRYKWSCHGHQRELRPGWLQDKFIDWKPGQTDVHPTNIGMWNPESIQPSGMPQFMRNHPFWGLKRIV